MLSARRVLYISVLFLLVLFCGSRPLFGAENFSTSYRVSYNVSETGETSVVQKISITNLTRDFYASEHKLRVGSRDVSDVWARDSSGNLNPQVLQDEGSTTIQVPFGAPVAGRGETYQFELGYKVNSCKKQGEIWRVDIPGVIQTDNLSLYELVLNVPRSLGQLAYVSPAPAQQATDSSYFRFEFNKNQLTGGVRAGFGSSQVYSLHLKFYLENPLSQKAYLDMPLPSDILGQQKVVYQKLSPAPEKIYSDEDGNYLARYLFRGGEQQTVDFKGLVFLYPLDREEIFSSDLKIEDIPSELREKYTQEREYWEVNNKDVRRRVEDLVDAEVSVVQNLESIYEYVVAHLSYGQARLPENFVRLGAVAALTQRNDALCTEYADLFIALSRAAGIPARLVEGYAYSENKEDTPLMKGALHAWVEVYVPTSDGGQWIQIDPTWGSTTGGADYFYGLDLAHVAFVRKGTSSTEPFLLADYESSAGDWLEVHFGDSQETYTPQLETRFEVKEYGLSGLTRSGTLIVQNIGKVTAFNVKTQFNLDQSTIEFYEDAEDLQVFGNTVVLGNMLPWSGKKVHFRIKSSPFRLVDDKLEAVTSWKDFSLNEERIVNKTDLQFLPVWKYIFSWYSLAFLGAGSVSLVVFLFVHMRKMDRHT